MVSRLLVVLFRGGVDGASGVEEIVQGDEKAAAGPPLSALICSLRVMLSANTCFGNMWIGKVSMQCRTEAMSTITVRRKI